RAQQRFDEVLGADDAAVGRVQRGDGVNCGLSLADEAAVDEPNAVASVRGRTVAQGFERADLGVDGRDDQLAQTLVRHPVCGAELVQQATALDAQPRLERPCRVVQARVN